MIYEKRRGGSYDLWSFHSGKQRKYVSSGTRSETVPALCVSCCNVKVIALHFCISQHTGSVGEDRTPLLI